MRWRKGRWSAQAQGDWLTGNPSVSEESQPSFIPRNSAPPASFQSVGALVVYSWPKTDLAASYTYNRNHLPFTTFAVLGAEVNALESGFHADSKASLSSFGFTARTLIGTGIRVYVATQLTKGSESVLLTDSAGVAPSRTLSVQWQETGSPSTNGGRGPGYVISAGAEFSIGGGPH